MTTVILGAAGTIGRSVVTELVQRGEPVRVVGRNASRLRATFGTDVEVVSADLATGEGRARALAGASAAMLAIGLPYTRKSFSRYPALTTDIVRSAATEGVRTFVQIGTVYPYGRPQFTPVTEEHPLEPASVKGRYRMEQEQATLAADDPDGMRTAVLRLPDFLAGDTEGSIPGRVAEAAVQGKTAYLLGPIDTKHEYVFTPDVGPVVVDLLARPEVLGRAYNMAGSGVITQRDLAAQLIAASGNQVKERVVSPGVVRAAGLAIPLMRELAEMSYLLTDPVLLDETALAGVVGPIRHTSYADAVPQVIEATRRRLGVE